jgi:hypothetical protein
MITFSQEVNLLKRFITMVSVLIISFSVISGLNAGEVIIKKMTTEELVKIVTEMGSTKTQIENSTTMFFYLSNVAIMAEIQGEGTDIRLISINEMEGSQDAKLIRVNDWNKEKRFSKAYVDDDGDIVFEHDVDFEKGITREQLKQSIRTFSLLAFLFHNG